ncbi:histidine kinase,histidine kinase [Xenococcus sp. PCC 7305]|uniref:sensor histidine kinase n=1 Tax=Xenococcus sp. PCC 7305 TaxID=102125 RepID=UPI0002AD0F1D|nr:ATP-binding protein [Xenococcus sp. PCC 7305]ELS02469.1 histidine kinase,histidine kinase [Xenococcus sp. PCC 7305]
MNQSPLNKLRKTWKNFSVRQRGMIIIAIPVTCFAVSLPTVSWSHFDLIEDEEVFDRLAIIRSISKNLLQSTANAQWGVQSYVLTEHSPFLESYNKAIVEVPEHIENLPESVEENLSQKEKLTEIERFSEQHLALLSNILDEAAATGSLPPQELEQWIEESDNAIAELHHRIENLAQEEHATLVENRQHLEEHQDRGFLLVCLFVAIGILGSLLAVKLFFSLDHELALKQTELQQLNQQLHRSNQQLERFTANASHQLRGPLAAILSNAQVGLLTPTSDSPKIRQRLEKIVELTKSNNNLVTRLLSLARYESMNQAENLQKIDLVPFLKDISDRLSESIADSSLHFTRLLPDRPVFCNAESDLLAQVIENLLDNARKYTPEGGKIQLQISQNEMIATIKIIDNGRGIAQENLDKIFERFYRVESARKTQEKGFGLGLAIAKQIIRLHNGHISAQSSIGKGTTFTIELPMTR